MEHLQYQIIMFYDITYDFVFFFSIMRTGTVQFCTLTIYDHFYSTGYNNMGATVWEEINHSFYFLLPVTIFLI